MPRKGIGFLAFAFLFAGMVAVYFYATMPLSLLHKQPRVESMNFATTIRTFISSFDPARIGTAQEYEVIHNLLGRLVKYENNQLQADIAESFSVEGNSIVFKFSNRARTLNGHVINAEDAQASLKRLILLKKSAHGDIRRFLCPQFSLSSINDECPGIKISQNNLILTVVKKPYLQYLLSALQSADYSIIPKQFIADDGALINYDYSQTSGLYRLVAEDEASADLEVNPGHYLSSREVPQKFRLMKRGVKSAFELFESGAADLVLPTVYYSGELAKKLANDPGFERHQTLPIRVAHLQFSKKAIADFSKEHRLYAAKMIERSLGGLLSQVGGVETYQFFQPYSDGTLGNSELKALQEMRSLQMTASKFPRKMTVGAFPPHREAVKSLGSEQFEVVDLTTVATTLPESQRPDLFYGATDSSWKENLSLIGYSIETGAFHLEGFDAEEWFTVYLDTENKPDRLEALRKLHYRILNEVTIYPLQVAPYFTLAKPTYSLNQEESTTVSEWHRIRRK